MRAPLTWKFHPSPFHAQPFPCERFALVVLFRHESQATSSQPPYQTANVLGSISWPSIVQKTNGPELKHVRLMASLRSLGRCLCLAHRRKFRLLPRTTRPPNATIAAALDPRRRIATQAQVSMSKDGSPVQALYDLCKKTFTASSGTPASPPSIKELCSLLDTITPSDVGLKEDNLEDDRGHGFFGQNLFKNHHSARVARWAQPITYLHIYECDSFQIGIFCLPTSSVIPLHDHPRMTVLSKLLYGSMHVKAYDWTEPACIQRIGEPEYLPVRLAKLQVDTVLTAPCETSVLYPKSGGNLHCFTAITPCAVLDVLAPPYSEAAGRNCTYYHDYPFSSFSQGNGAKTCENEEDYAWLDAIEAPDDLYIRSGKYVGPAVHV